MTFCFFVGNKRSGTTLFNKGLNLHPNFYAPHEADIVNWLLGTPVEEDWEEGLNRTKELLGNSPEKKDEKTLIDSLERLRSFDVASAYKTNILCYGDKKPAQHLQENHRSFAQRLGQVKYIQLVRHPLSFLKSVKKMSNLLDIGVWAPNYTDEEILDFWANKVTNAEKIALNVKLEDFVENPDETLQDTFEYLGLQRVPNLNTGVLRIKKENMSENELCKTVPKSVEILAEKYGYEL
jgi:hypothetical protein